MAKMKGVKTVAQNRKARHDYFVIDSLECGLVLQGCEVKSLRAGQANLKESYVKIEGDELWVIGMHISPYQQAGQFNPDPLRPKKLLANKSEIRKLKQQVQLKGHTLIPLDIYLKDGRMKLTLGLCVGKRLHDKRQSMKEADDQRAIERALSNHRPD